MLSLDTSTCSPFCSPRPDSQPPQPDFVVRPLRIFSEYTFQYLEQHREQDMTHSDTSSLSSFETTSSSSFSAGQLECPTHLTIAIEPLEDSGDDEICSASSRKEKRPLPPVPLSPPSRSPPPTPTRSPRARPLPPTPGAISISVIPATPLHPSTPPPQSPNHLSPPRIRRLPQPLSVQPSENVLAPPTYQLSHRDSLVSSIISSSFPEVPTPRAARRRRLSKLKRYLGETVPDDLVPIISSARDPQAAKDLLAHISSFERPEDDIQEISLDPAIISRRLRELEDDQSLSEDEELIFADDDEAESQTEDASEWKSDNPFIAVPLKRHSKKWLWDKGGNRREEQDFTYVLRALRSL